MICFKARFFSKNVFLESLTSLTTPFIYWCCGDFWHWMSLSQHLQHSLFSVTHVRGLHCNSNIDYRGCSSVWIMGVHLLHNHWYRINRHTNQGQRVLSVSAHCPSVILASGGRQPQPSQGEASSIKSLRHREERWRIWSPANFKE